MARQLAKELFPFKGWTPVLDATPVREALLVEPEVGLLWAIEAKIKKEWPGVSVHRARNGVEACLLAGSVKPDFVALSSELEHTNVCDLIEHLKSRDRGWSSVVVLSTGRKANDELVRRALAAKVDAVVPLPDCPSRFGHLLLDTDDCAAPRILHGAIPGRSRPTPIY